MYTVGTSETKPISDSRQLSPCIAPIFQCRTDTETRPPDNAMLKNSFLSQLHFHPFPHSLSFPPALRRNSSEETSPPRHGISLGDSRLATPFRRRSGDWSISVQRPRFGRGGSLRRMSVSLGVMWVMLGMGAWFGLCLLRSLRCWRLDVPRVMLRRRLDWCFCRSGPMSRPAVWRTDKSFSVADRPPRAQCKPQQRHVHSPHSTPDR